MPFIPSPYLMTLPLHRNDYLESSNSRKNKPNNRKKIDEEEKKEKSNIPSKCLNCSYRFYEFCNEKRESINNMDKEKIDQCREMEELKERRELLKKAKWTPINKALLKILLSDKDPYSTSTFIYDNFDISTSNFKVWELLTILAFSEEPPLHAGQIVTYDDYFKIFNRYLEYIGNVQDGKLKSVENTQSQTDNASDYATLILLKNFLFQLKDNENVQLLQEMLTKKSSMEDINTAITLLLEEGLLDVQVNKQKNKIKSGNE